MSTSPATLLEDPARRPEPVVLPVILPQPADGIQGWIDEAPATAEVGEEIHIFGWCYYPAWKS